MLWIILAIGLVTVLYLYFAKKFAYFKNHGIPYEPGYFPFGSSPTWKLFSGKLSFARLTDEIYEMHPNDKIVGYYGALGSPTILIKDLELAKKILIKDFEHFVDRRPVAMDKDVNKYFANMLTALNGKCKELSRFAFIFSEKF